MGVWGKRGDPGVRPVQKRWTEAEGVTSELGTISGDLVCDGQGASISWRASNSNVASSQSAEWGGGYDGHANADADAGVLVEG